MDDLKDETEEVISLHGLGFIQVKLGGQQRLHVWHPGLPRRACFAQSSIHNHRFSFTSRVLVGEQINQNYYVIPDESATHTAYSHNRARMECGGRPWDSDFDCIVVPTGNWSIKAGDEYVIHAYDYHATTPGGDGFVATLMTKHKQGGDGAHSLCEIGTNPDTNFDRKQWSPQQLWEVVNDVLGKNK